MHFYQNTVHYREPNVKRRKPDLHLTTTKSSQNFKKITKNTSQVKVTSEAFFMSSFFSSEAKKRKCIFAMLLSVFNYLLSSVFSVFLNLENTSKRACTLKKEEASNSQHK